MLQICVPKAEQAYLTGGGRTEHTSSVHMTYNLGLSVQVPSSNHVSLYVQQFNVHLKTTLLFPFFSSEVLLLTSNIYQRLEVIGEIQKNVFTLNFPLACALEILFIETIFLMTKEGALSIIWCCQNNIHKYLILNFTQDKNKYNFLNMTNLYSYLLSGVYGVSVKSN